MEFDNLVYVVQTQHNNDIELEGVFSTEENATRYVNKYIEKHPEYSNDTDNWRIIWVKPVRVDEGLTKILYPIYKIECTLDESGQAEWLYEETNIGFVYGLLGEVDFFDDENDKIFCWYVHLADLSGNGVFDVGKQLINDFIEGQKSSDN
jgi:hypothetical protein